MALKVLLGKVSDADFLRQSLESILQLLMETDVSGQICAQRSERSDERITYRKGYRERSLQTCVGQLELQIPKLREGTYFPPFLEQRRMSDKALFLLFNNHGSVAYPREKWMTLSSLWVSMASQSRRCRNYARI